MTLKDFINLFWDAIELAFEPFKGKPLTAFEQTKLKLALTEAVDIFIARYNIPGLRKTMMLEAQDLLKTIVNEREGLNG